MKREWQWRIGPPGSRPVVIELSSRDSCWHVYRGTLDLGAFGSREAANRLADRLLAPTST